MDGKHCLHCELKASLKPVGGGKKEIILMAFHENIVKCGRPRVKNLLVGVSVGNAPLCTGLA